MASAEQGDQPEGDAFGSFEKSSDAPRKDVIDRRGFLRRAAMVAWATPAVSTVLQSRAAAQVTCLPCASHCVGGGVPCCEPCFCSLDPEILHCIQRGL
jgi:hypothetical protein